MIPVIVVADLCVDLLFTGSVKPVYGQTEQFVDDYSLELGGSAAIFASQLTRIGGTVRMCGQVGDDLFGSYVLGRLQGLGLETKFISTHASEKTAVGLGLVYGTDRAMLTCKGTINTLSASAIFSSGLFETAAHLHIASYFLLTQLQSSWPAKLAELKSKGWTISLDTNWAPENDWGNVHAILPFVDVFLPNENELLHISGCADVTAAIAWAKQHVKLGIVKLGGDGCVAVSADLVLPMAVPVWLLNDLQIVDTTGAGDNFDAGFIFSWLQQASIGECLYNGMICGTQSLRSIGGIAGQCADLSVYKHRLNL